ncbi:hypothetical protein D7D52_26325 [Nocardia yunnanensis]|uniref:Uncharacterized protein n=1 Tax=Nocardia yunnanensis TaxID=2382165 RepID=A0A386ZJI1_9NOCA|nr:hypothetical protein D7D52_26325 [Nocardia yunnanensis]
MLLQVQFHSSLANVVVEDFPCLRSDLACQKALPVQKFSACDMTLVGRGPGVQMIPDRCPFRRESAEGSDIGVTCSRMEARPHMTASDEEQQISELVIRLTDKFPHLTAQSVDEEVRGIHREFDGHRVREFIPLLVERIAERQLSRRVSYRDTPPIGFAPAWRNSASPAYL